jgi:hypothetical protein
LREKGPSCPGPTTILFTGIIILWTDNGESIRVGIRSTVWGWLRLRRIRLRLLLIVKVAEAICHINLLVLRVKIHSTATTIPTIIISRANNDRWVLVAPTLFSTRTDTVIVIRTRSRTSRWIIIATVLTGAIFHLHLLPGNIQ